MIPTAGMRDGGMRRTPRIDVIYDIPTPDDALNDINEIDPVGFDVTDDININL